MLEYISRHNELGYCWLLLRDSINNGSAIINLLKGNCSSIDRICLLKLLTFIGSLVSASISHSSKPFSAINKESLNSSLDNCLIHSSQSLGR